MGRLILLLFVACACVGCPTSDQSVDRDPDPAEQSWISIRQARVGFGSAVYFLKIDDDGREITCVGLGTYKGAGIECDWPTTCED